MSTIETQVSVVSAEMLREGKNMRSGYKAALSAIEKVAESSRTPAQVAKRGELLASIARLEDMLPQLREIGGNSAWEMPENEDAAGKSLRALKATITRARNEGAADDAAVIVTCQSRIRQVEEAFPGVASKVKGNGAAKLDGFLARLEAMRRAGNASDAIDAAVTAAVVDTHKPRLVKAGKAA
jgi:hypothetical protein